MKAADPNWSAWKARKARQEEALKLLGVEKSPTLIERKAMKKRVTSL